MKILITGSAGFIFSNFVLYALQKTNWNIVGIDKLTYAGSLSVPENKRYKLYINDICDYHTIKKIFEIEKPDIVIHGAAESHVDNSINSSYDFIKTNVVGTHSVLEASLKAYTPQKIINISTDEVYGSVEIGHSKEHDALDPRSPYSSSKASADLIGRSYYSTHNLPIITTRACNNFGPRQHEEKFIPKIITNIMKGKKVPLYGDGKNIREWIYVLDHFEALKTIIEKGVVGETYNISAGQEKQNIDIINTIFEIMGVSKDSLEYVEDRKGHDRRYSVDTSKLNALGWMPQFEFNEAIAHTIGWYKANTWFWNKK